MRRTASTLSPEHELYPSSFLASVGLLHIVFCESLHYNSQRRRDVPDLASGNLYIDVENRPSRRKRHSFHHELWHIVDYHLRGNQFTDDDAEWNRFNPAGFSYGSGGKHMRHDSESSQLASSPSREFLNRYSTSSIAEDKAEVWAALMCYQQLLNSDELRGKGRLLQQRVRAICSQMDDAWWGRVVASQAARQDYWELHQMDASPSGRVFWRNYVTGDRQWTRPAAAESDRRSMTETNEEIKATEHARVHEAIHARTYHAAIEARKWVAAGAKPR